MPTTSPPAPASMDTAQPELEYSIGALDQTHIIKLSTVYELPFGEDRRWLTSGIASKILGGWRIAAVQNYASGTPIGVTANAPLPIFNGTNRPNVTGEDWRAPIAGDEFDPTGRSLPESRRRSPRRSGRSATPLAGTGMSGGSGICRRTSVCRKPSRSRAGSGSTCGRKCSICSTASSGACPTHLNFSSANFGMITASAQLAEADAVRREAVLVTHGDSTTALSDLAVVLTPLTPLTHSGATARRAPAPSRRTNCRRHPPA